MIENRTTTAWKLYQDGRLYNNRLVPNQYRVVNTNVEFYAGNQWNYLPQTPAMQKLPKATFNVLKRVGSLLIASLTNSKAAVQLSPLAYYDASGTEDPDGELVKIANAQIDNLLEKFDADTFIHQALEDGAQTGDYCAHFYWDPDALPFGGGLTQGEPYRGEIKMEIVDGINVMFGNPNDRRVEVQPYIIIEGRDTVQNLREEMERWRRHKELYGGGKGPDDGQEVQMDAERFGMAGIGGETELTAEENGKALYVLLYTKVTKEETMTDADGNPVYEDETDADGNTVFERDGKKLVLDAMGMPVPKRRAVKQLVTSVHVTKATKTAVIYEDVDTGLSRYPIAWGNWQTQKNQYHGRALVTELIPNQILINQMYALMMRYNQMAAFPKIIYNGDIIPTWSNEVGEAIAVHGLQPQQAVSSMVYTVPAANIAGTFFTALEKIFDYTKECMGVTDAQMGNVQAENTSAIAILTQNSSVPLENIRLWLKNWVEQIAQILLDMMGTYYGQRPVVFRRTFQELVTGPDGENPQIDPMTGMMQTQNVERQIMETFDFSILKDLALNLRIDVGEGSRFSEASILQTLSNLRQDGTLTAIQFLERVPDRYIPNKAKLLSELRESIAQGELPTAAGAAIQQPGSPVGSSENLDLPTNIQQRWDELPNKARGAIRDMARPLY